MSAWCPTCFAGARPVPLVDGLDVYLTILDRVYRDPAFRERGLTVPEDRRAQEVIARSAYLRGVIQRAREVAPGPPRG